MKLKDRIAIVTGGGKGIGAEICLRLASEGAKIVIAEMDIENGEKISKKIQDNNGEAIVVETNKDPLNNALKLISGKWKIKILEKLSNKPIRFGKLKKNLDTITSQMLSKQLKEMENDTLVKRKVIKSNPITVEYSLTQFGNSSLPIIRSLIKWGSINKRKMSRVIEKDQERAIDLLNDEIRFKNLQRKNFYG